MKNGTAIQTGSVGSGNWSLGVKLSGVAPSGVGVTGGSTEQFGSLIDTQNGAYGYAEGAIMLNNFSNSPGAGAGQYVGFRGPACCSAQTELYQDSSNTFHVSNAAGGVAIAPATNYPVSIGAILRTTPVTLGSLTGTYDTSPPAGDRAVITDATACSFNTAVTGGGGVACPVVYVGGAWRAG